MTRVLILITIFSLNAATVTCTPSSPASGVNQKPAPQTSGTINKERIKQQAQELCDAMLKGDFDKAAELTHPKLIELMGGRTRYISKAREAMSQTQSEQFRIESVTVLDPRDLIEVKTEKYVIVPTTMKIKVPEGLLVGEGFLIGLSLDGGNNWTFVDSGGISMDKNLLKTVFPLAADKLKVPEAKRPTLYRQ